MIKKCCYTVEVFLLMLILCSCGGYGVKESNTENSSAQNEECVSETDTPLKEKEVEVETTNIEEKQNYLNDYFPYSSDQEITFDGRFYFSDLLEKQTKVYIKKESSGEKGEVWHITFERVEYDSYDSDGRYEMPDECLDLYYFLVQKNTIYWYSMPGMPEEEMKAFCEEGIMPKDYVHVICQKKGKKDALSDEETGNHEEISVCGIDKDIRQYKAWYIKPGI